MLPEDWPVTHTHTDGQTDTDTGIVVSSFLIHLLNGHFPSFPFAIVFACGLVRHFIASLENTKLQKRPISGTMVLLSQLSNLRDPPPNLKVSP